MSEAPQPARSPGRSGQATAARIPKTIAGFELIEKLGQGGMGAVFKARQISMERLVAIKILPPRFAASRNFIERFQREARASAKIAHPNVVQGIDVGCDEASGLWYFAMELVEGESLREALKREGRLEERRALRIARDIAAGLDAAHRAGLVHRDIKPDNIMLTATGAKILDLGLAKEQQDDATLTQTGASLGTPLYMAPEQVRGQLDAIDTRTDLYALGATLFHLVTGGPPFTGETSAVVLAKHLGEPPPRADRAHAGVSRATADLIASMLAKDQGRRPEAPAQVIRAIDAILAGHAPRPADHRHAGPGHGHGRPPVPRRRSALIAAVAGIAILGVGAALLMPGAPAPPAGPPPAKPPPAAAIAPAPAAAMAAATAPAVADRKAEILAAIEYIRTWEQADPDRYDEADQRYAKVLAQAKGAPWEFEIADRVDAARAGIEERRRARVAAAAAALLARAEPLAAAGDIDAALAALKAVPADVPATLAPRIGRELERLAAEIAAAADGRVAAAVAAIDVERPEASAAAIAELERLRYAPARTALAAARAKLDDVGERRLAAALQRFDAALIDAGDPAAAAAIAAEAARDPSLARDHVVAMQRVAAAAAADAAAVAAAGAAARAALIGSAATLPGRDGAKGQSGTVVAIDGETAIVEVRIEMGDGNIARAKRKVPVADLMRAAPAAAPAPAADDPARIAQAARCMRAGDDAGAERLLAAAADAFPLTARYRQALQVRRLGAAEAAALAAWTPLGERVGRLATAPLDEAEASRLAAQLEQFLVRHGQSRIAAEQAPAVERLQQECQAALGQTDGLHPIGGPVTIRVWSRHARPDRPDEAENAVRAISLAASLQGRGTWSAERLAMPEPSPDRWHVDAAVPAGVRFDRLVCRIADRRGNGTIAEIEVLDGRGRNLVRAWSATASSVGPGRPRLFRPSLVVDGRIREGVAAGSWIPDYAADPAPWIEIAALEREEEDIAAVVIDGARYQLIAEKLALADAIAACAEAGGVLATFDRPQQMQGARAFLAARGVAEAWAAYPKEWPSPPAIDGDPLQPFLRAEGADAAPWGRSWDIGRREVLCRLPYQPESAVPAGTPQVAVGGMRYGLLATPMPLWRAQAECRRLGGRLATFANPEQLAAVRGLMAAQGVAEAWASYPEGWKDPPPIEGKQPATYLRRAGQDGTRPPWGRSWGGGGWWGVCAWMEAAPPAGGASADAAEGGGRRPPGPPGGGSGARQGR